MTDAGKRAVIFGAGGGIGAAIAQHLIETGEYAIIHAGSRRPLETSAPIIRPFRFDLLDETSIAMAVQALDGPVDLVFIATGLLHDAHAGLAPEKSWRSLTAEAMTRVVAVNTIGPAIIAKHFLPVLRKDRPSVFAALSARVGSIGDNRLGGWHSYRASKAALNMLIANFAIELARTNPNGIVAGLHPGTVATELSQPFQRGVAAEKLFTPSTSAAHLMRVIDGLSPQDSGKIFAWDGQQVPW